MNSSVSFGSDRLNLKTFNVCRTDQLVGSWYKRHITVLLNKHSNYYYALPFKPISPHNYIGTFQRSLTVLFTIDLNRFLSLKKVLHYSDKYHFSRLTCCLSVLPTTLTDSNRLNPKHWDRPAIDKQYSPKRSLATTSPPRLIFITAT